MSPPPAPPVSPTGPSSSAAQLKSTRRPTSWPSMPASRSAHDGWVGGWEAFSRGQGGRRRGPAARAATDRNAEPLHEAAGAVVQAAALLVGQACVGRRDAAAEAVLQHRVRQLLLCLHRDLRLRLLERGSQLGTVRHGDATCSVVEGRAEGRGCGGWCNSSVPPPAVRTPAAAVPPSTFAVAQQPAAPELACCGGTATHYCPPCM